MTKLCQIALQKGCSWQHSQQQCINPLQTIGVLQLSNCESTAPQSFPCPIILLLSVYCFCFRFPLSPGIDKLLQRPIPSFFLMSRPLLMVSSYSWLLLPSESCLSVLPSNPLIVLQSLFSLAHFCEVSFFPGPLLLTAISSDIYPWSNQVLPT